MPLVDTLITAFFSSVFGGMVALLVNRLSKTKAERTVEMLEKIAAVADTTMEQLLKKLTYIDCLEKRIDKLESVNQALWVYTFSLIHQLRSKKIKPVKPPKELKDNAELMELLTNGGSKEDESPDTASS